LESTQVAAYVCRYAVCVAVALDLHGRATGNALKPRVTGRHWRAAWMSM